MKRLKVLVIAEAANPQWASVPLVGWSLTRALADLADVHLVTHVRNRQAIEQAGWSEGEQFTAIDSEKVAAKLYRLARFLRGGRATGWTINMAFASLAYYYFEHLVWKRFATRLCAGAFDLVHRITPLSPTAASPIAGKLARAGVPFVWGPINGGLPWPKAFDSARRAEFEWLSYIRGAYKLLPGYRATRRCASALLIGSRATWQQMPRQYHHKCIYIPENAIDPQRFTVRRTRTAARPLRAVFLGRLVPYKGPDMLLEAAEPLLRRGEMTLQIIGDGPLRAPLEQFVTGHGLGNSVHFAGWVEHEQVQHQLAQADVLTFPSIREFGGAVVLEAMAVGVVPIVVNYGGPGELVTAETGYTIPLGSRKQIIAAFRRTLEDLAGNPACLETRSIAARQRVFKQFTWSAKAKRVITVYRKILAGALPSAPCDQTTQVNFETSYARALDS